MDDGFAAKVREVLSDPQNLPKEFTDWVIQHMAQNPLQVGIDRAPGFQSTGLTGSTEASRYVGATTSGHPTDGYHLLGDFVIDQTGTIWICTAAGDPGTWAEIGAIVGWQHDDTLVAYEPIADFEDSTSAVWTITDDPTNDRVKISLDAAIPGGVVETLVLDSHVGSVTSSAVLASGVSYLIAVQGTYTNWNLVLDHGTPESDAMFPSPGVTRVSTEVGSDADTIFAYPTSHPQTIGHWTQFKIDTGNGSGFTHVEPIGGPFTTPQPSHLYQFQVTGAGSTISFEIDDSPISDNYGELRIVIYGSPAPGTGGIVEITSTDGSLTVVDPLGPSTDLSIAKVDGGSP